MGWGHAGEESMCRDVFRGKRLGEQTGVFDSFNPLCLRKWVTGSTTWIIYDLYLEDWPQFRSRLSCLLGVRPRVITASFSFIYLVGEIESVPSRARKRTNEIMCPEGL